MQEIVSDTQEIVCTELLCKGVYIGPEFVNGDDVAHQFSNLMSAEVGDYLKELYIQGNYAKVDFTRIIMTTEGMGTGQVIYTLEIPLVALKNKCDAFTSFDHAGGWNHTPDLAGRKSKLGKALLKGESLNISELKTTPEGLQEYWIQWKHKETQASCSH